MSDINNNGNNSNPTAAPAAAPTYSPPPAPSLTDAVRATLDQHFAHVPQAQRDLIVRSAAGWKLTGGDFTEQLHADLAAIGHGPSVPRYSGVGAGGAQPPTPTMRPPASVNTGQAGTPPAPVIPDSPWSVPAEQWRAMSPEDRAKLIEKERARLTGGNPVAAWKRALGRK